MMPYIERLAPIWCLIRTLVSRLYSQRRLENPQNPFPLDSVGGDVIRYQILKLERRG